MPSASAYGLVFHGSRDPRSQQAAQTLTTYVRQRLQVRTHVPQALGAIAGLASSLDPPPASLVSVQDTYLECHPQSLTDQLRDWLRALPAPSAPLTCRLIPVFLSAGVHVMEDIPTAIAALPTDYPAIHLRLTSYLGCQPGLTRVLNERMAAHPVEAWVLLAHGSRRSGANEQLEARAAQVGAVAAFWATPPSLEMRIQELAAVGLRRIGILPYFLFTGGVTDAIAQTVTQLTQSYPDLSLTLVPPLDANLAALADIVVNLADT